MPYIYIFVKNVPLKPLLPSVRRLLAPVCRSALANTQDEYSNPLTHACQGLTTVTLWLSESERSQGKKAFVAYTRPFISTIATQSLGTLIIQCELDIARFRHKSASTVASERKKFIGMALHDHTCAFVPCDNMASIYGGASTCFLFGQDAKISLV